jgi:hypothetical protein
MFYTLGNDKHFTWPESDNAIAHLDIDATLENHKKVRLMGCMGSSLIDLLILAGKRAETTPNLPDSVQ